MDKHSKDAMAVVIAGAAGRMGRALVRRIAEMPELRLAGALDAPSSEALGADAGALAGVPELGVPIGHDAEGVILAGYGVIDFTAPAASADLAEHAARIGAVHIIGATGMSAKDEARIAAAARKTAIVKSGNMSVGVTLMSELVRAAAGVLGEDWDIEIAEMHHRHKADAPSGTARLLGAAAALGRGGTLDELAEHRQEGSGQTRKPGGIGFSHLRGGDVIGEHEVVFAGAGEQIRLHHSARTRDIFASGACRACLWAHGRDAGLYTMEDVLGLGGVHT